MRNISLFSILEMNSGEWNIQADGAGDRNAPNDPNWPGWKQVQSLFVSSLIPAVSMAVVGHFIKRYNDQQHHLEVALENEQRLADVVKELEMERNIKRKLNPEIKDHDKGLLRNIQELRAESIKKEHEKVINKIKDIEHSREKERQEIVETIQSKYSNILDILDIACSPIRKKELRIPLQQDLLSQVSNPNSRLIHIHMTTGMTDIFENDNRFAGSNRTKNGKLWRVYSQLWEEKAEKLKYKNAWFDLKQYFENQK